MPELHIRSAGDGLWSWRCSTCGRSQFRTSHTDALRLGLAHEHIPPKETPMSTPAPAVKADPGKPFKTYAAIASAFITSFLATNATDLPPWAVGLLTAVVAAIAVYVVPNPLVQKRPVTQGHVPDERGQSALYIALVVLVVVVILLLLGVGR